MKDKADGMGKKRKTQAQSEAIQRRVQQVFKGEVQILHLVSTGRLVTFSAERLKDLKIDETYQRMEVKLIVNDIIKAVQAGGMIPDPISVAKRPNGDLYIMDGQQRYWAAWQLSLPLVAMVYDVPDIETERQFFTVLQNRRNLNAQFLIHAWSGESATMIRELDEKPSSLYLGRINFGRNNGRRYDASTLIRSVAAAMSGVIISGPMTRHLSRADFELKQPNGQRKAQMFFDLLAVCYPPKIPRVRSIHALGLALFAHRRWQEVGRIYHPRAEVINKLQRMNWLHFVPTEGIKYLPMLERALEHRWPESAADRA